MSKLQNKFIQIDQCIGVKANSPHIIIILRLSRGIIRRDNWGKKVELTDGADQPSGAIISPSQPMHIATLFYLIQTQTQIKTQIQIQTQNRLISNSEPPFHHYH